MSNKILMNCILYKKVLGILIEYGILQFKKFFKEIIISKMIFF